MASFHLKLCPREQACPLHATRVFAVAEQVVLAAGWLALLQLNAVVLLAA